MIQHLHIRDFRLFKDEDFVLGECITVISGANATGKSTLLGLLGTACELKVKDGKPLIGNQFRAEFSDLFKADPIFDPTDSNKYTVDLIRSNGSREEREFRVAWQEGGKRFRLIPKGKRSDGTATEAKMSYPVLYLGLSRLFPIGEADESGIKRQKIAWSDEDRQWYVENYRAILSLSDSIESIDNYSIQETSRKHGVGVTTDKYSGIANSAGQDNLGQILVALLSFMAQKRKHAEAWDGGLLLIDEIDATLHPIAQNRLFDLLYNTCRKLGMQVVFTTHSLSLLEHVCERTTWNSGSQNAIELYSLSTANGPLDIARSPSYESMHNALMSMSFAQNHTSVKLFSEDAEARWFAEAFLNKEDFWRYIKPLDVSNGCDFIMKMYAEDYPYFKECIVLFDGDVTDATIEKSIVAPLRRGGNNIVKLPGKVRPEQVIYDFLLELSGDDQFWSRAAVYSFNKTVLVDHGPLSDDYKNCPKERDNYKSWFNDHLPIFNNADVIEAYKRIHPRIAAKFVSEFRRAYNIVAERVGAPRFMSERKR